MTLFEASVHGLRARVRNLDVDLNDWIDRTSATGDLAQHHLQVLRLSNFLGGARDAVVSGRSVDPKIAPPFAGSIDDIPDFRRSIGSIHLLWEFFRDKLAQRDLKPYATHLGAADDLAWACYQPFRDAATTAKPSAFTASGVKESPLVFYSTDRTPFAQARTKTLHPMGLDSKDLDEFAAALQRLPVPVIGIPWEVANRMPETTLVGHEAGHVIAEDLGLAAEARQAMSEAVLGRDADGERKSVWLAWCDEVLADVIGVLATGGAFVESLEAELAGKHDEIRSAAVKPADPGKYPPPMLRVELCQQLLARCGVARSTAWTDVYGKVVGSARAYLDDVTIVTSALLDREWEAFGNNLVNVLPWDAAREADAVTVAVQLLASEATSVAFDVRTWVAASMHAYRREPDEYMRLGLDRGIAAGIVARRSAGVRSSHALRRSLVARSVVGAVDDDEALLAADRAAGADLARQLGF